MEDLKISAQQRAWNDAYRLMRTSGADHHFSKESANLVSQIAAGIDPSVAGALGTVGIYLCTVPGSEYYFLFEVDDSLVAHQLNRAMSKDGILAPDGWNPSAVCAPVSIEDAARLLNGEGT